MSRERSTSRWSFVGILIVMLATLANAAGSMMWQQPWLHMLRFALLSGCVILLVVLFPRGERPFGMTPAVVVMLVAVLSRAAIFPMETTDDMNRYLWEGRLVSEGINPYLHAPDDPALAALAQNDPYHDAINLPFLSAAYPPFALEVFAGVGKLSYSPRAIKITMAAFDLGCVWLILQLLRFRQLDVRWALLYAVNPVVLYAFAGESHFDAMQNFFLLAALVAFDRRRWGWMFLLAGLAVQSKYVALVACPFLIRRDNLKWMWTGTLAVLLPFLPFATQHAGAIFHSITTFARDYGYNGSIQTLLQPLTGHHALSATLCRGALIIGLFVVFVLYSPLLRRPFRTDPITGMMAAWSLLLVFAPTVHFWYLSWLLPLLPIRPLRSWLLLSFTISATFVTRRVYEHTGRWIVPDALMIAEWAPVLFLLLCEAASGLRHIRLRPYSAPHSISVIIPTLNEGNRIGSCIQSAQACAAVAEVLVADGGSRDDTVKSARAAGAKVLENIKGGRGGQILTGLRSATGDVAVIVHADTIVPANLMDDMMEVLRRDPTVGGGVLGSVFDGRGGRLRLIEFLNDFRAAFLNIGFGDQVQFFRREAGLERSVFCGIPLMEDVELSLRLNRIGRSVFLFGDARTSARTWQQAGYARAAMIIRLVAKYLCTRLWKQPDSAALFRQYYRVKEG